MSECQTIRRHLALTQRQMAAAMGLSLRAYSDVERAPERERRLHVLAARQVQAEAEAR